MSKYGDSKVTTCTPHGWTGIGCPYCRIKELEAQQKWISVEEELPELYDEVLVYHPLYTNSGVKVSRLVDRHIIGWEGIYSFQATHWQRLPPAPKGER